jgi:hypothetical protein
LAEDLRASFQDILVPGGSCNTGKRGQAGVRYGAQLGSARKRGKNTVALVVGKLQCHPVVTITDTSSDRLALTVERFGRVKPERSQIVRPGVHTRIARYHPRRLLRAIVPDACRPLRRFPRSRNSDRCAAVYLIAPALRFHPTTDLLQRYLSRGIEIIRVGLAKSWRCGLRVVFRQ